MAALALAIFQGLAAIPAILGYVKDFAAGVSLWYMQNATKDTLTAIADAAALAARANSDEERYAAALAWKLALSRPRQLP
jgi:hypothetical protein